MRCPFTLSDAPMVGPGGKRPFMFSLPEFFAEMSALSAELTNESMRYANRAKELYRQVGSPSTPCSAQTDSSADAPLWIAASQFQL